MDGKGLLLRTDLAARLKLFGKRTEMALSNSSKALFDPPGPSGLVPEAGKPIRAVQDQKPKVALIGAGYWGRNLLRNLATLDSLSHVCDRDESVLSSYSIDYPALAATRSFEEVLLEPSVTGVMIATPAACHYRHVKMALLAGKDVFVEKPLALTYKEGLELVRMAGQRKRILMVGHVLEYHPGILKVLDLISRGVLGEVRYIYSHRLSLGKIRREENILWSFAPHDISVILRMLGQLPLQVVACGGCYIQPQIPDVTVSSMLFENGVRAHIHVSWIHPFKEHRLVVIGSRRMACLDDVNKSLVLYDQRVEVGDEGPVPVRGPGQAVDFPPDEPLRLECEEFLEAVQTRQEQARF